MRSFIVRTSLGLLAAGTVAGGMLAAGPADATATAAHHWRVTVISPPVGPASTLTAVACPTSTWCAAVGWDGVEAPETGTQAYFTLAESRGRWSPGAAGLLPPGTAPAAVDGNGIACTGKGSCVAVGSAFIAIEQHGIWQRAFRPSLPRNAAGPTDAVLYAVTCTGPGSCEAVGSYGLKDGQFQAMSVTESGGRWHRATGIGFPPHITPGPNSLDSIACTHAGSCVAVGTYSPTDISYAPVAAREVKGHWLRAAPLKLPAGAGSLSQLSSVSCRPSGQCVAVGVVFETSSPGFSMMATLSHGHWSSLRPLRRVPSGAPRGTRVILTAVSCARTFCLAAGSYSLRNGTREWIVIRIQGGAWASATGVGVPAGNPGALGLTPVVNAASCSWAGACAVVGSFQNESGETQALAAIGG